MRKVVAALVVAVLALTLTGCGGEEAPAEETPVAAPVAAPAATDAEVAVDVSGNDSDSLPMAFPSFTTTDTPAVFATPLEAGRPMLIFFYDDAQDVTASVRGEIDSVMADYRGLIDLITLNTGGASDSAGKLAAVTYATELGVSGTPYILVVDGGGNITWRSKGYAVKAVIEREVERATR